MARVFGYGRASTDKQQITLKSQEEICIGYFNLKTLMEEGLEWAGWFPDAAVTSKTPWFERPMGHSIIMSAHPGDRIVVSNFDRAFRSVIDCDTCLTLINERKISLTILDMDVDTKTPLGRAFMKIIAVIKELEREEISRRTREALQYNKRMGKKHAAWTPIGWAKSGKKTGCGMIPAPNERSWCKEIVRLYDEEQLPFRKIEEILINKRVITTSGTGWHLRRVRFAYSACKCGFPRLYTCDLPSATELRSYMASHDGRPPQLQAGAIREGILHTLPPMQDHEIYALQRLPA